MPGVNRDHVFNRLRPRLPDFFISTLMTLPACDVWIHERHIHNTLGLTSSDTHGPYHALSCVISTIQKGYGGNRKKNTFFIVDERYARCSFNPSSSNTHDVAFTLHGSLECFDAGGLNTEGTVRQQPRWFRFGPSTCCDLATQLAIVAEAVGDESIEMSNATRRRRESNFKNYYSKRSDDGYSRNDVPAIAYKFHHQLQCIFKTPLNTQFIQLNDDGTFDVGRRAFDDLEFEHFESILRQMLVTSTIHGKLRVVNNEWKLSFNERPSAQTTRSSAQTTRSRTPPPGQRLSFSTTSSSQGKHTPSSNESLGTNERSTFTGSTGSSTTYMIPDALRISELGELIFHRL
jgi:hypothetical protein